MGRTERATYEEWRSEQLDPTYYTYIITGKHHWKKEFMESLKTKYDTDYTRIDKGIKDDIKKLNYRPMGKKKHLLFYENLDRIPREDMVEIVEYIKNPSKYGILVVSIDNWGDKKALLKNFKYLESSKTTKLFDLDFPTRDFIGKYMNDVSKMYEIEYESIEVSNYLFRRLNSSTEDIIGNIQTLATLDMVIDKEAVTTYTEDYSTYNYDQLYSSLGRLHRVKIPYISYNDLIESGRKEISIMINVRKHFHYLYQAKYLKLEGILRNDDIIEMRKKTYDRGEFRFTGHDIFDLSNWKINYYLKESDKVTLMDIIHVNNIIDRNMPDIADRSLGVTLKDEDGYDVKPRRRTEDIENTSFKTILEILGREL